MKLSYPVKLSAIKHEFDPKWEVVATTMHLELPSGVNLQALKYIYRRHIKPHNGENGEYHLIIREKDGGAPRKIRLESKGTKTKDYALFAVVKKPFSEYDGLEAYLDTGCFVGEEEQQPEVIFEAELILPENLVEQAVRELDAAGKKEGFSVTLTTGNKSVTVGKKDNHDA